MKPAGGCGAGFLETSIQNLRTSHDVGAKRHQQFWPPRSWSQASVRVIEESPSFRWRWSRWGPAIAIEPAVTVGPADGCCATTTFDPGARGPRLHPGCAGAKARGTGLQRARTPPCVLYADLSAVLSAVAPAKAEAPREGGSPDVHRDGGGSPRRAAGYSCGVASRGVYLRTSRSRSGWSESYSRDRFQAARPLWRKSVSSPFRRYRVMYTTPSPR